MAKQDTGVVNIHGKNYETVALRVKKFREAHKDYTLTTEVLHRDAEEVVMKASILDDKGRLIATGHSEEKRASSTINRTSALENAETSAIGRALAAFGLGGTEFATADEVANAIQQQRHPMAPKQQITPNSGAGDELDADTKQMVELTRDKIVEALEADKDFDAYSLCESFTDEMLHEKLFLWSLLDSKARSRIKKQADLAKPKKAANG